MAFLETTVRIDLRWRDMDMLGHVNQAVYHEFLEEGRAALMVASGMLAGFVLAHVDLDYLTETRQDHGPVTVRSQVREVGRKKIVVGHEVVHASGTVAARGTSIMVCWDMATRRSRELTPQERAGLGVEL